MPVLVAARDSLLEREGFRVVPQLLRPEAVARLADAMDHAEGGGAVRERDARRYAMRNLLALVPQVGEVAGDEAVRALVEPVPGPAARLVRGLLFDKRPGANWKVAWHQDLSIAVRRRADVPGFGPWSVKAGVPHVQPPAGLPGGLEWYERGAEAFPFRLPDLGWSVP